MSGAIYYALTVLTASTYSIQHIIYQARHDDLTTLNNYNEFTTTYPNWWHAHNARNGRWR